MNIIICAGIHEPELTKSFIANCFNTWRKQRKSVSVSNILVFPGEGLLALSKFHILEFLGDRLQGKLESPVIFISFSAGVVGAIGAAIDWQLLGGQVQAFIAVDGWGVPLWANFPIHRLSHDYFTHWSSSLLGSGHNNFYADPPVDHLSLWHSPQVVQGYWVDPSTDLNSSQISLNAAQFLYLLLQSYEEKQS
jgi:hypothetical protein